VPSNPSTSTTPPQYAALIWNQSRPYLELVKN
jgi:hypothetical protein